jgi:hypothetical protein
VPLGPQQLRATCCRCCCCPPAASCLAAHTPRPLEAEVLAPVGRHLAGLEPVYVLEERILLVQGAPAANLPFSILASSKACKQQAFSRAG